MAKELQHVEVDSASDIDALNANLMIGCVRISISRRDNNPALIQPFLAGLHGVSVGVPLVSTTGFDWKDATAKLGLATCFQIVAKVALLTHKPRV
jgi:hypothetical protein